MPGCGPLVGVGSLQDQLLDLGVGDDLQTDRQTIGSEAAGQGDGRQPGQVEGV